MFPVQSLRINTAHSISAFPTARSRLDLSRAPSPIYTLSIPRRCVLTQLYWLWWGKCDLSSLITGAICPKEPLLGMVVSGTINVFHTLLLQRKR